LRERTIENSELRIENLTRNPKRVSAERLMLGVSNHQPSLPPSLKLWRIGKLRLASELQITNNGTYLLMLSAICCRIVKIISKKGINE